MPIPKTTNIHITSHNIIFCSTYKLAILQVIWDNTASCGSLSFCVFTTYSKFSYCHFYKHIYYIGSLQLRLISKLLALNLNSPKLSDGTFCLYSRLLKTEIDNHDNVILKPRMNYYCNVTFSEQKIKSKP